jgi:hypothetical protein
LEEKVVMTNYRNLPAPPSGASTAARVVFAALVAVAAPATSAGAMEQISMVYERIVWNAAATRSKLEGDFQRMVAASGLKVSAAEIAGAAQAAFVGGTEYEDTWEQQTIIRGCGPAGDLCFVITCNNCRGAK